MNDRLKAKLAELPKDPGVYFHKNANGEIIYIGKAAVLRNRVRQYFQKSRLRDAKTDALVSEIADTDWMVVDSEIEALFLEAEMVRRYMPQYNILLRDDKALSYIRIDYASDYPTVTTTRRPLDDDAKYFGPYFSGFQIREALKVLRRVFPFATKKPQGNSRPSLHYHLGLDPGLEGGRTSLQDYRKQLRRLMSVLEGKKGTIEKDIDKDMRQASENQQFEEAAVLRNQLRALKEIGRAVIFSDKEFLDISKDRALTQLMELFGLAKMPVRIEGYDISHMSGRDVVASMVVFTNGVSDKSRYRKFKMSRQTNDDAGNIFESISRRLSQKNSRDWGLPDLMLIDGGKPQLSAALKVLEILELSIPCISVAKRDEEIIVHKNASNVDTSFLQRLQNNPVPGVSVRSEGDFLVVNLHVGHVNASSHSKNLRGGMTMSPYNDVVKLFQRIRDEAHRFAVSYHTNLKRARQTKSSLEDIPGVGAVTKRKLLKHFGSVRGVEQAQKAAIEKIVGTAMAGKIYRYLH